MLMRRMLVICLLVSVPSLTAAPIPKPKAKAADKELILGTWEIIADSADGTLTEKSYKGVRWEFRENGEASILNPMIKPVPVKYELDPERSPKHLNWILPVTGMDHVYKAIYVIEDDCLKVQFGEGEIGRPTGFGTKVTTLKRVNKESTEPKK